MKIFIYRYLQNALKGFGRDTSHIAYPFQCVIRGLSFWDFRQSHFIYCRVYNENVMHLQIWDIFCMCLMCYTFSSGTTTWMSNFHNSDPLLGNLDSLTRSAIWRVSMPWHRSGSSFFAIFWSGQIRFYPKSWGLFHRIFTVLIGAREATLKNMCKWFSRIMMKPKKDNTR